jgi:hypothetical protein
MWLYARRKDWFIGFLKQENERYQIRRTSFRNLFAPGLYILTIVVSLISFELSHWLFVAVPLLYILLPVIQGIPQPEENESNPKIIGAVAQRGHSR